MYPSFCLCWLCGWCPLCFPLGQLHVLYLEGVAKISICYCLGLVCSQTQLCHIGLFVDFVEQLHVSAFVGHHQVVLREIR